MFASNHNFYFVFANAHDAVFTDSLLRLDMDDYLWLQLRKNGYENIFFVRDTPAGVTLEIPDEDSGKFYSSAYRPFWKKPHSFPVEITLDPAALCGWLAGKKKHGAAGGPVAWVIESTAFQKCFEYAPEQLDLFTQNRGPGADTVVMRLPMQLSVEELELFTSETSIFARKTSKGSCISQPIYDMIHTENPVPVFDRLRMELGESMIQLGAISYVRISAMLRWVAFRLKLELEEQQLQDYANFLYWYVYSPDLRAYTKDPIHQFSTYRELSEYLLTPGAFAAIDERVAVLKSQVQSRRLTDMLYRICPLRKDEDRIFVQIFSDSQQLRQLAQLPYPADFSRIGVDPDVPVFAYQRWLEMQRQVRKPNTMSLRKDRLSWISAFMEHFNEARSSGDDRTALRAAEALCEAVSNLYLPVSATDRVNAYLMYLKLSRQCFVLQGRLQSRAGNLSPETLRVQMEKDSSVRAIVNSLMLYRQMLKNLENALILPDSKFTHLLREASELLPKEQRGVEPVQEEEREYTPEELEAISREFECLV